MKASRSHSGTMLFGNREQNSEQLDEIIAFSKDVL